MKILAYGGRGKRKIIIFIIILLFAVCGGIWWFLPVHFLSKIVPEEVEIIRIFNGNTGNEFEIINPNDISNVVNAINQISFKKDCFASEAPYWYFLTFINENGEEVESLSIQNPGFLQKDITQNWAAFYCCNGELGVVGDYLESLEAVQFPDYKRDPDFLDN